MQRIQELSRTDRGRLAQYLVAVSLAFLLFAEYSTVSDDDVVSPGEATS
jgi:hypothetical protein